MVSSSGWMRVRALVGAWLLAAWLAGCAAAGGGVAPQRTALDARPNGIAVRSSDGAVFISDDLTNSVLSSADGHTFTRYAALPAVAGQANTSLSALAFADAQTLLIARFGFGTAGALLAIGGPNRITTFGGPDPARRRLGLAVLAPGQVLSTWFVKNGSEPQVGGLSLLTYDAATGDATERDLLLGLGKPVGVAVAGGSVLVTDAARNQIVSARLDALLAAPQPTTAATVFAQIDHPDLLAADSSGALYTKCGNSGFCRIAPNGAATVLANDLHDARGVAVDEPRRVVYVVDRAAAGGTSYVRALALR